MGITPSFSVDPGLQRRHSVLSTTLAIDDLAHKSRIFKKPITDDYTFSKKIAGTGYSGPVRLATHNATNKLCAVKRYDKDAANLEQIEFLKSEAQVYLLLDHPNICKLFSIYEDNRYLWIVMEYCAGLELSQRLRAKHLYSENDACQVTRQMTEAVHYLHSHHIVHRDLKLENWLYEKPDEGNLGRLKLIDFGFSKLWHPNRSRRMQASCGSLTYVSPDTLKGAYTNACDMWSLGVTVYFLLVGMPPFSGPEHIVMQRILRGAYTMNGWRWAAVSEQGKDFVRRLLVVNPEKRMSSGDALNHPWLVSMSTVPQAPLPTSVLESFREFAVASRFKRAALTLMAYSLTTKDIEDLAQMFERFDCNKDGCISLADFMEVMGDNFKISREEIEALFNAMHTVQWEDAGGFELHYSGFIAAVLQTRLCFHENAIREAFMSLDVDRSGFITTADLRAVIGDTFEGADVDEILRAADIDGDGRIGYDEFLAALFHEADTHTLTSDAASKGLLTPPEDASRSTLRWRARESQQPVFLRRLLRIVDQLIATGRTPSPRKITASSSSPQIVPFATLVSHHEFGDPQSPHARPWDPRTHGATEFRSSKTPLRHSTKSRNDNVTLFRPYHNDTAYMHEMESSLWVRTVEPRDSVHQYTTVNDSVPSLSRKLISKESNVFNPHVSPRNRSARDRGTAKDSGSTVRVKPLDLSVLEERTHRSKSCPVGSTTARRSRFFEVFGYDSAHENQSSDVEPEWPQSSRAFSREPSGLNRFPTEHDDVSKSPGDTRQGGAPSFPASAHPKFPFALFNEHQRRP